MFHYSQEMSANPTVKVERKTPTRREAALFRIKTALLQARRLVEDRTSKSVARFRRREDHSQWPVIARSVTPLWTETDPRERSLMAGKIQNLRIAALRLNGVEVPAGEMFSFWKHVGRATRRRGFVAGRELREGCIIPNIGGGLCQLSNALFDAASEANFEIAERHRHTQIVPGSLAEADRDATVFWNYVDLRFRSSKPFRLAARLDAESLIVEIRGEKAEAKKFHQIDRRTASVEPGSCATCEAGDCHRVIEPSRAIEFGRRAWLVDEYFPEFDHYMREMRAAGDVLCIPLDGKRFRKANYAWSTAGFGSRHQSLWVAAVRSYRSRKLAAQGAARQRELLQMYRALAQSYASRLSYDVLHLTVQQNLLPFLWQAGVLGGRTFDVLMSALPMREIQRRLDQAAALHPESSTLGDFRADSDLVACEAEALSHARTVITPHTEIASLFPERAMLIDWSIPKAERVDKKAGGKPVIVFPSSAVGRKGCYELRDAIRGLDARLITLGPYIESGSFWDGLDVERGGGDWLARADLVVLPAFVEHRPRRLLSAAAAGIPVIASEACGVGNVIGIQPIRAGEIDSLRSAILKSLPSA